MIQSEYEVGAKVQILWNKKWYPGKVLDRWESLHFVRFDSIATATASSIACHPGADDDGLWYFTRPGASDQVQIESPSGNCPFLLEHHSSSEQRNGRTPQEVADLVLKWLAP